MRHPNPVVILSILAALCAATLALAQPADPTAGPNDRVHAPEQRGKFMQRMIERRLEELEAEQTKLEQIQTRLDAGESLENIRADTDLSFLRPNREQMPDAIDRRRGKPAQPGAPVHELAHDEMLSMLRDIDPDGARELARVKEHRPERFKSEMEKRRGKFAELSALREENPELFALKTSIMQTEREMFQTIREHMQAGGEPDDTLRTTLRPLVEKQLKAQSAIRSLQIVRMERKLDTARASIESESDNLDASIDKRLDEVINRITRFHERRGKRKGNRGERAPRGTPRGQDL